MSLEKNPWVLINFLSFTCKSLDFYIKMPNKQTRVQPTETNTAQHNLQILLVVGYPTTNKCLVGIGYPTTNIHHFKSWCCVPNTNNCWVVLGTQLFSEKDPAWEKNHFCLKGFFLVQQTSLLWLILNLSSSSTKSYNIWNIWSKVG